MDFEAEKYLNLLEQNKNVLRLIFLAGILSASVVLVAGNFVAVSESRHGEVRNFTSEENVTVVTSQRSVGFGDESGLHAYQDGELVYYTSEHDDYWDVDPADGNWTVSYAANDVLTKEECNASTACVKMIVEKLNMRTGETETVYTHLNPLPKLKIGRSGYSSRWHDVDLVGDDGVLVADIFENSVYLVNTSTGMKEWEWDAQEDFEQDSGGKFPEDFTHVNDVEMLQNGEVIASLRNHDQVVFIDPEKGLIENKTLGEDDNFEILNGQHNPDYIPRSEGGPALLVADSTNDRAIEYELRDGEWQQTWIWQDSRLSWGRDADRLPNGHTLISDSNGDRVIEVDRTGEIVSKIKVSRPYEAERLGTPDESGNGPSASRAELESRTPEEGSSQGGGGNTAAKVKKIVYAPLPKKVEEGIEFLKPPWMGIYDLLALAGLVFGLITWIGLELYWSRITLRNPVKLK